MVDRAKAGAVLRTKGPAFAADVVVNFVLPFLIYSYPAPRLGDVQALLASSVPPILWSIAEFIRHRRLDALSMLVLAGIVLSLLAFFGGGGPRMLQLREKLVTGVIGIVFLTLSRDRSSAHLRVGAPAWRAAARPRPNGCMVCAPIVASGDP